jgi:hypothetical protein
MKSLRIIFALLISLLAFNSVRVNHVAPHEISKKSELKFTQNFNHTSFDNFVEDTAPNESFDLEEDCDDTEDDFTEPIFSPKLTFSSTFRHNKSFHYSHAHQSVKRFILYCSLKLYC